MRSRQRLVPAPPECVFNQSATGLTDTRHGLLATGERQVGNRDGGGDRDRRASLLPSAWRQRRTSDPGAHYARQQSQKHSSVRRSLHLVTEQFSDSHRQRTVGKHRAIQQDQLSGRTTVREACRRDCGHRRHRSRARNGTNQSGGKQTTHCHLY
jgi:hypothetical protein